MTALPDAPARTGPVAHRWLGLFAVIAATVMNLLDSTIIGVAAPAIRDDLGGSYAALQWMAASYTLALAVGLLTGGRLGDIYGRKPVLLIGAVGFVISSIVCGLAISPEMLITARVFQGLFAAVMVPQGLGLIRDLFPPKEISKAFAAFGPTIGLSTIIGPVVAGLLIKADLLGSGWRMVFLINVPIGLFALIAGWKALPSLPGARGARLDLPGALLAGIGMCMLIYPLVQGREKDWPLWLLLILAGSVPVLGVFALYQWRRKLSGATPLVELSVFSKISYTSGLLFAIVFFGAIVGFSLALGLLLQVGLGYTPLHASLVMLPWVLASFVGSVVASTQGAKLGRRILHLSLAIMGVGIIGLYWVFSGTGTTISAWELAAPMATFGLGMGMIFVPLFGIILGDVEDQEVGSAASMLETVQQLGSSLGIAALGTIFFNVLGTTAKSITEFKQQAMDAAGVVTLVALGLTALAFALVYLLPTKVRALG